MREAHHSRLKFRMRITVQKLLVPAQGYDVGSNDSKSVLWREDCRAAQTKICRMGPLPAVARDLFSWPCSNSLEAESESGKICSLAALFS
jgi:hypothetical protein